MRAINRTIMPAVAAASLLTGVLAWSAAATPSPTPLFGLSQTSASGAAPTSYAQPTAALLRASLPKRQSPKPHATMNAQQIESLMSTPQVQRLLSEIQAAVQSVNNTPSTSGCNVSIVNILVVIGNSQFPNGGGGLNMGNAPYKITNCIGAQRSGHGRGEGD